MGKNSLDKEDVSNEQLNTLSNANKQGFDSEVIKEVASQKKSIREQLLKDVVNGIFTQEEIDEKTAKLNEVDDTGVSGLREIQRELTHQRLAITRLIRDYDSKLESAKRYFGRAGSWSALKEYKEEFKRQNVDGKKEWFDAIDDDIAERKDLFKRAEKNGLSVAKISTMRRSQLRDLLGDIDNSSGDIGKLEDLLKTNTDLFAVAEIEEKKSLMLDSTRYEQGRILKETGDEIQSRSEVLAVYRKLPSKYQSACGNFMKLSFGDRENAIEKVDKQVIRDYKDKLRNHSLAVHISEDSKDSAYAYIKDAPVNQKIEAMDQLENAFKAEKKLYDEYENLLKGLDDKTRADKLKMAFLDNTYEEKEKLIADFFAELKEEAEGAESLKKEYFSLLKSSVSDGDISAKTLERAKKQWEKYSIEDKRHYVDNYESIMSERVEMREEYEELADELGVLKAEQNEKFFNRGLVARRKEVVRLKQEVEKSEKLEAKYSVMLDKALDENFISERTYDSFMEWFEELDTVGMGLAVAGFEREMAPRIVVLDEFESLMEDLLPEVVSAERKKFDKEGLTGRKEIVKKMEAKYGTKEVNEKLMEGYMKKLDHSLRDNLIGQATYDAFAEWFEEQSLTGKKSAVERFDSQMFSRKKCLKKFLNLPDSFREEHEEFFEAGHHERMKIVEEGTRLNAQKDTTSESDKSGEAGDDSEEMSLDDQEALIDEIENSKVIKDDRIVETTFSVLAEEMEISEKKHHGAVEAANRTSDLRSDDDRVIAEALKDYTDGDFVLEKDGTASEVVDTGMDSMMSMRRSALGGLKEEAKIIQTASESDPTAKNIQFHDTSGKEMKAGSVTSRVEKMKERTDDNVFKMASDIARRRGLNLDEDVLKESLDNRDGQVELKNAA